MKTLPLILLTCAALLPGLSIPQAAAVDLPYPVELFEASIAHQLPNSIPTDRDRYAAYVAMCGDTAVATARNRADLFRRRDGEWRYQGTLTPPAHSSDINTPLTVALEGDTLILGGLLSVRPDYINMQKGAAYVFERSGAPWRNAWNVTVEDNERASYSVDVTEQAHATARTDGWRYQLVARFVHRHKAMSLTPTMVFRYGDSERRYAVYLDINYDGDLMATLPGASPASHILTTGAVGATDYHTHEMTFDPDSETVTYRFNGNDIHTWPGDIPEFVGVEGIFWGGSGLHGTGRLNVHAALFETTDGEVLAAYDAGTAGDPVVAPDPVTQGWALNGFWWGPNPPVAPQSPDPGEEWKLRATLTGEAEYDPNKPHGPYDLFASRLAISGDTLVAGARMEDTGGKTYAGAAYVFERNGNQWDRQRLVPSTVVERDFFGYGVDIDGDTIIVGAPHDPLPWSNYPGRAFVFGRGETGWTQRAELKASDGVRQEMFGSQVAVHGNRIAVSAQRASVGGVSQAGAAYVFEWDLQWKQRAKLTADPVVEGGEFGSSLDLHDDKLIAGAFRIPAFYFFLQDRLSIWQQVYANMDPHHPRHHSIYSVGFAPDGTGFITAVSESLGGLGAAYIHESLDYGNVPGLLAYTRKLLYYPDALHAAIPNFDPNKTAFRFKHLLYGKDVDGKIRAQHEEMHRYYGDDERNLALAVEAELRKGLALHPDDPALGNLLLDIYYDRTQAEMILARKAMQDAEHARVFAPRPPGGFVIDQEIPLYRDLLQLHAEALRGYFSLLADESNESGDPPLGYRIFRDLVPTRGLAAAMYEDENGNFVSVSGDEELFDGYKDLTLLINLLRDYGRTAHALGWLLAARKDADDIEELTALIAHSERFVLLQGDLLLNIFPNLDEADPASGLAEAVQGWSSSLDALADLRQLMSGEDNILGFAPDFLVLIPNLDSAFPNSFDEFKDRFNPDDARSPLKRALNKLEDARANHADFRGYEDQYAHQINLTSTAYRDRLFEIVGARPGDHKYSEDPLTNEGSELYQQAQSIRMARLRIERNQAEINNLAEAVQIEINRAADVSAVIVEYGNQRARLTEVIGHIQAAQAATSALSGSIGGGTASFIGGVGVAALQAGAEVRVSELQAQKERLAAEEQAAVRNIDSAARVKTLLLEMRTLAVDSMTAALALRQEVGRMTALYREKAELEARIAEARADLASRYFADPVHRLWAEASLVEADLHFASAQRWLFFMLRAFEYKWNRPFSDVEYMGRTYSAATLFRLRNADELIDFYHAIVDEDVRLTLNRIPDDYWDWFSMRRDFMGLRDDVEYVCAETGESLDAISVFRAILATKKVYLEDSVEIKLEFNTVRQIPGGSFFLGPIFDTSGNVHRKGLYLNKIHWLGIRLRGDHSTDRAVQTGSLTGSLTYGGTSFIRNARVGQRDPDRPDRFRNEMTAYSTRYWFYDQGWMFRDAYTDNAVQMQFTNDPRGDTGPPTVFQNRKFIERSVATTGWILTVPLKQGDVDLLLLEELDDIEIYFYHYALDRN